MPRELDFYFDIGSAYSYLASSQMKPLAERTGASVTWHPFLLGGVFKAAGNDMPARVAAKAVWMLDDLQRWAGIYGVPFRFPSTFPLNTLRTQRVLTAARRAGGNDAVTKLALTLFKAYWVDDQNVSVDPVIEEAAKASGLDGAALLRAADDQAVKDELRTVTEHAVKRGAFGAPTFFVGEQMFWGNDRLHFVEDALKG